MNTPETKSCDVVSEAAANVYTPTAPAAQQRVFLVGKPGMNPFERFTKKIKSRSWAFLCKVVKRAQARYARLDKVQPSPREAILHARALVVLATQVQSLIVEMASRRKQQPKEPNDNPAAQ
jgi:hypothetical protein